MSDKAKVLIGVLIGIVWILLGSLGCAKEGTSTGNPVQAEVSFVITGSAQASTVTRNFWQKLVDELFLPRAIALTPPPLVDSNGSTVVLSTAWISLKEIELKVEESSSGGEEEEISFSGPYFVDLLSNTPPPIDTQVIAVKPYRRVKMKLHEQGPLPPSAPAGLDGNSIFLEGTIGGVAFSYSSADSTEYEIGGSNSLVPEEALNLLVVIRFSRLFEYIDLSSVSAPTAIDESNRVTVTNPCPLIDSSADDLYTCFRKGMESETNLGKDEDGDNDLDDQDDTVK